MPLSQTLVDAFLADKATQVPPRVVFAIDATASRERAWRTAQEVQGSMFAEVPRLEVKLIHFGGSKVTAHPWTRNTAQVADWMQQVRCRSSLTRWYEVFERHILPLDPPPAAIILIGDCWEEESLLEFLDLPATTPIFAFQEGDNSEATYAFADIAQHTNGAHLPFDTSSPAVLRKLLAEIAAYASGGRAALEAKADSLLLPHLLQKG